MNPLTDPEPSSKDDLVSELVKRMKYIDLFEPPEQNEAAKEQPQEPEYPEQNETSKQPQEQLHSGESLQRINLKNNLLFVRYNLQRGFLRPDVPIKEEDMPLMDRFMRLLEEDGGRLLSAEAIEFSKIYKVLFHIIKLAPENIPQEDMYGFRERAARVYLRCAKVAKEAGVLPQLARYAIKM